MPCPKTVRIGNQDYSGLLDVDRSLLGQLNPVGDKVAWLKHRVDRVLLCPLRPFIDDRRCWEQSQLGLVAVTAICAGISAASTFLHGVRPTPADKQEKSKDKCLFKQFVRTYMAPTFAELGEPPHLKWLYGSVRCGLAHGFTVQTGSFEQDFSGPGLTTTPAGSVISVKKLFDSFSDGWDRYCQDVLSGNPGDLQQKFEARWDQLYR